MNRLILLTFFLSPPYGFDFFVIELLLNVAVLLDFQTIVLSRFERRLFRFAFALLQSRGIVTGKQIGRAHV